jgi:hypothetical protein
MEQLCGSRDCRREHAGGHTCRAEQGLGLCRFCCARVRNDLGELPLLYEEFESSLTRFPFAFEERVSGGEMKGLCLNEASVNARREIISVLASWSGMVIEERRLTKSPRRDVPDLAAFLTCHLDWLLAHPAGPYFGDEVAAMAATARRASRSSPALRLPLGRCVEEGCDGGLYATGIAEDAQSPVQVRCEAGHVWQCQEWLALASRISSQERQYARQMSDADAGRAGA